MSKSKRNRNKRKNGGPFTGSRREQILKVTGALALALTEELRCIQPDGSVAVMHCHAGDHEFSVPLDLMVVDEDGVLEFGFVWSGKALVVAQEASNFVRYQRLPMPHQDHE